MSLANLEKTDGSLGEREILWEHKPQASISTAFPSSHKLSRVFLQLDRNMESMLSISFRKHRDEKRKPLVNFDYQNVNSLYTRHHYAMINSSYYNSSLFLSSFSVNLLAVQNFVRVFFFHGDFENAKKQPSFC